MHFWSVVLYAPDLIHRNVPRIYSNSHQTTLYTIIVVGIDLLYGADNAAERGLNEEHFENVLGVLQPLLPIGGWDETLYDHSDNNKVVFLDEEMCSQRVVCWSFTPRIAVGVTVSVGEWPFPESWTDEIIIISTSNGTAATKWTALRDLPSISRHFAFRRLNMSRYYMPSTLRIIALIGINPLEMERGGLPLPFLSPVSLCISHTYLYLFPMFEVYTVPNDDDQSAV